jgi:hypothetical protein
VGLGRTYTKLDRLTYRGWLDALRAGRSYVSDGFSHLMDFTVNGVAVGTGDGTVAVGGTSVEATVRVTALLDEAANATIAATPADGKPYWDVERARVPGTREVPVEFLVNGRVVATRRVVADGKPHDLRVTLPVVRSGWVAARILPSSHTNPVFVTVDRQPMRPSSASARWALEAVGAMLEAEDAQYPRERARGGLNGVRTTRGRYTGSCWSRASRSDAPPTGGDHNHGGTITVRRPEL